MLLYGKEYTNLSPLDVELALFRDGTLASNELYQGKFYHFQRITKALWPKFVWNPWSEQIIREACDTRYLGIAGAASSTKSHTLALWLIVNWLCSPHNTLGLVFSTTLSGAKLRIWASIKKLLYECPGLPCKIIDNPSPALQYVDPQGRRYDTAGIMALPSERGKAADSCSRAQGIKAERVFVVVDESTGCAPSIAETIYSNLRSNPYFWCAFLGNPDSKFDPHGQFCTPQGGWDSISVDNTAWSTQWKEEQGRCLHFDAVNNPNYLARENHYPFLQNWELIDKELQGTGSNSGYFWKMFRGFWAPVGAQQTVFSEADILKFQALRNPIWKQPPVRVAGLDPSFTADGDRPMAALLYVGQTTDGKVVIHIAQTKAMLEDVTNKSEPLNFQRAKKFKEFCDDNRVQAKFAGYDATGGGIPFGDILQEVWSPDVLPVQFGGKASEYLVGQNNPVKAFEQYSNRATEIIFNAVQYLRNYQLTGVTPSIANELCSRRFTTKEGERTRFLVEAKTDFKGRNGYSPDESDAVLVALAVVRERLGLVPGGSGITITRGSEFDWAIKMREIREQSQPKGLRNTSGGWGGQKLQGRIL